LGLIGWINDILDNMWNTLIGIKDWAVGQFSEFQKWIQSNYDQLHSWVEGIQKQLSSWIQSNYDALHSWFDTQIGNVGKLISNIQSQLGSFWTSIAVKFTDAWNKTIAYITEWWIGEYAKIKAWVNDLLKTANDVLTLMIMNTGLRLETIIGDLRKWSEDQWAKLEDFIFGIISGWMDEFLIGFDREIAKIETEES